MALRAGAPVRGRAGPRLCGGFAFARRCVVGIVLVTALCAMAGPSVAAQALPSSEEELRKAIDDQRSRAKARRDSLSRLTEQERALNTEMAQAEDAIGTLEDKVARQEEELVTLEAAERDVRMAHGSLVAERGRTEDSLRELLALLWPLLVRQQGGGRGVDDMHGAEREYTWTQEIYKAIGERQQALRRQEADITAALERREQLTAQVRKQLLAVNADKDRLLTDKLRFRQKLSAVRKQMDDAEGELQNVLDLIVQLNIRLEQVAERGDIEQRKGRLPWPAKGRLVRNWNPGARPPVRGVGLAVSPGSSVRAVSWGKVVHNDILRGFGRVVILMHGKAYYTLYAFLGESPLRVGQEVAGGGEVGEAGFYPDANGPGVYFELRFHQKAINPDGWLNPTG